MHVDFASYLAQFGTLCNPSFHGPDSPRIWNHHFKMGFPWMQNIDMSGKYTTNLQWIWSKSKLQNVSHLLLLMATSSYTHFEKYMKY